MEFFCLWYGTKLAQYPRCSSSIICMSHLQPKKLTNKDTQLRYPSPKHLKLNAEASNILFQSPPDWRLALLIAVLGVTARFIKLRLNNRFHMKCLLFSQELSLLLYEFDSDVEVRTGRWKLCAQLQRLRFNMSLKCADVVLYMLVVVIIPNVFINFFLIAV